MRLHPFKALRPTPEYADRVASVPYDTINTEEARQLADGNPESFLHVIRSEIDLPPETDPHSDAVYAQSATALRQLQDSGVLIEEEVPSLYVYRITLGEFSQTGVVGCGHVEDYDNNIILKHEKTRPDKEADRTRLNSELRAQPGPVFLTYRDVAEIDAVVASVMESGPLLVANAEDGALHEIWRVEHPEGLVDAFAAVPASYIADGHHRAAAAANAARNFGADNPDHTGREEYNWFLSVLFPASQLRILPYNRAVKDLNGQNAEAFVEALSEQVTMSGEGDASPAGTRQVSCFVDGKWIGMTLPEPEREDAVAQLDVSLLQDLVLNRLLGVEDPRRDERIEFIGGIRGTGELEDKVNRGDAAVAFSMWPVTVDQMMDIADAGAIMPPKSTWFEPKLRSGLLVHTF